MPGAWEFSGPEVFVATLTREMVSTKWAMGYRAMQLPPSAKCAVYSGAPFDHARNLACEATLQEGSTWLLFLDDDVVAPPDVFRRLASHGKDIVSAVYYRRAEPIVPVMMRNAGPTGAAWVTEWVANSLIEVDLVGAGCLLIHRRVLERMKKPWFEWELGRPLPVQVPGAPPPRQMSEDFAFCRNAKEQYGFSIHVDTSLLCEHIGLGQSQQGGFIPARL